MNTNPLKQGSITDDFAGIGTVTHHMVRQRAGELAIINGRTAQDANENDWDQAKRELTGNPDESPSDAILNAAPESERWDPVPGSTGHQARESASEDEDGDGLSASAQLVEEGVAEAEHDQMLQAAMAERKSDE